MSWSDWFKIFKYGVLWFIVSYSFFFFLKGILPEYDFFFGIDEDGEAFDRREILSSLIGLPITYFIVIGYRSWKNFKWDENNDRVLRDIEHRFKITEKLKKSIDDKDDSFESHSAKSEEEELLDKIEKAIERSQIKQSKCYGYGANAYCGGDNSNFWKNDRLVQIFGVLMIVILVVGIVWGVYSLSSEIFDHLF